MFNFDEAKVGDGKKVAEGFEYNSGSNTQWLTVDEIKRELAWLKEHH